VKFIPQHNQILGVQVEITETESGIVMPDQQAIKASIFVLIQAVGPEVKDYKVGDIVLPYKSNQIFLRGGYHRLIFEDKEVLALAQDLPLERISVGGKPLKPAENGKFALPSQA
jgi:co-chaperonin GroES (HSP10)